jgi:NitT/TauT family transport system substrate-binding protein
VRHLVFLAGALAAAANGAAHAQALRVYGNTTTIELAPVLLVADQLGSNVVTVTNGGIPNLYSPTGADIADVATNAETQVLRQSIDHPDLRIILTVSEGFYRIVARRSAGISSLQDLRGKKIATIATTSSGYYLHKMLGNVGLSVDDVTVVPLSPLSKMPAALANRQIDAVTIWEPEVQRAADAIGTDSIEFQQVQGRTVYRELFSLISIEANLLDPTRRQQIVAFVRALLRASAQIRERPQVVWPLVARATGYDAALIEKVWHHEGYPGALVPDLLDVLVEEDVYLARERGRAARSRSELAALIDSSVLREALAD